MTIPVKVEDLTGLLIDLKRNAFAVRNVGSDPKCTFVYLELEEDKDPFPIVKSWEGRKAPDVGDRAAFDARVAEYQAVMFPGTALKASIPAAAPAAPPLQKASFIRRILGLGPKTT